MCAESRRLVMPLSVVVVVDPLSVGQLVLVVVLFVLSLLLIGHRLVVLRFSLR